MINNESVYMPRECVYYYPGMTAEDDLYLQHVARSQKNYSIFMDIAMGKVKLSPLHKRTKKEVFDAFGADVNYVFDIDTMI